MAPRTTNGCDLKPPGQPGRWPLVVCGVASAILLLDATAVYIGLPTVGADLDAGFEALQWTIAKRNRRDDCGAPRPRQSIRLV